MGHKDLTNIAHFTAGRFAGVDPQAENPDMNAFGERLMELDQLLRGNPLVARIQSAGIMTNEQMQRYHEAGIMEALELRKAQRG